MTVPLERKAAGEAIEVETNSRRHHWWMTTLVIGIIDILVPTCTISEILSFANWCTQDNCNRPDLSPELPSP
jgi:hypothetical protein